MGVALSVFVVNGDVRADTDAFEPDFVFRFTSCLTTAASFGEPDPARKGFGEDNPKGHSTMCRRTATKKVLDCVTFFDEGGKPARYEMRIKTEMSQMITVETDGGADYVIANPVTGRVASTTRILTSNILATKLCYGDFLTGDEFRALTRKQPPKR